jgi:hypothetical protein
MGILTLKSETAADVRNAISHLGLPSFLIPQRPQPTFFEWALDEWNIDGDFRLPEVDVCGDLGPFFVEAGGLFSVKAENLADSTRVSVVGIHELPPTGFTIKEFVLGEVFWALQFAWLWTTQTTVTDPTVCVNPTELQANEFELFWAGPAVLGSSYGLIKVWASRTGFRVWRDGFFFDINVTKDLAPG